LTWYGEAYYEGKEFYTNLDNVKPGELSEELKEAFSMTPGHLLLGSTRSDLFDALDARYGTKCSTSA
jgi:hypothetical protein